MLALAPAKGCFLLRPRCSAYIPALRWTFSFSYLEPKLKKRDGRGIIPRIHCYTRTAVSGVGGVGAEGWGAVGDHVPDGAGHVLSPGSLQT
jgi:hypothetical protein